MARHQGKWRRRRRRRRRRWWPEECRAKLREREREKKGEREGTKMNGSRQAQCATWVQQQQQHCQVGQATTGPHLENTFRPESREVRGGPSNEYCYGKSQWCNTMQNPLGIDWIIDWQLWNNCRLSYEDRRSDDPQWIENSLKIKAD